MKKRIAGILTAALIGTTVMGTKGYISDRVLIACYCGKHS